MAFRSGSSWQGRGADENPPNRFERVHFVPLADYRPTEGTRTEYFRDPSRSILSCNDSPDVGFDVSLNPYRGCEHGCIYCYARPTHEYLGFSAGLDFESRILVKERAPELLRRELQSPRWKPQVIALSGVTDPYQPVERDLRITRRCLDVLAEFRNPVTVVTKNHLVTRDIDLFCQLAAHRAVAVSVSITSLNRRLQRRMEPRTSSPQRRLAAIRALSAAGIPTRVLVAPVIPGLTDHELPKILERAADSGASSAGFLLLRLPFAVKNLFSDWVINSHPLRAEKVLRRIAETRSGQMNDPRFHTRLRGEGNYALQIEDLFRVVCLKAGLQEDDFRLSTDAFRRPGRQLGLF